MNVKNYEMNKPSEFCQLLYFENYKKTIYAVLTPTQIDLMNIIIYKIRENLIRNKSTIDYDEISIPVELSLEEIALPLNKYGGKNYESLLDQLNSLRKLDIAINVLRKNKEMEMTLTSFIHELTISKHKTNVKKKVVVHVSTKVLSFFMDIKKLFTKFYLAIQFSMVSKYSKLLYELLKDYEGVKHKTVEFELLIGLLNASGNSRVSTFSYFNNDVKKTAITEINEKSDIIVSYEPIKEKLEGQRKQVTKIKFNIEKQSEERLKELGLIQPTIDSLPFYNKAKKKLDTLVKGGYKVVDEDMWVQTDIKKNEEKYDCETRLDTWIKETPQEVKNEIFLNLARSLEDCEDVSVYIKDYLICGISTNELFTKSAKETIELMNKVVNDYLYDVEEE